ncbi:MAG: bifunctional lysylphosphatidylglycerol flippase/synthetase MprF [Actinomycetes bacterium]
MATSLVMLLDHPDYHPVRRSADVVVDRLTGERVPLPAALSFLSSVLVAFGVGLVVVTLWILLSPRAAARTSRREHLAARERARTVVQRYGGDTLDYFALRNDKQWFFLGESVVAYAVRTGVCLVSPDPIGPPAERGEVWTAFTRYAADHGWSVAVVAAAEEWLSYYRSAGMRPLYLGDEGVVDCTTFTLQGRSMKSLRAAHNRVMRAGYRATFHDPSTLSAELRESLVPLLSQSRRGERERGFSRTLSRLFDPADTGLLLAVAEHEEGSARAFIHWVSAASIDGWSLDVMRRSTAPDAPNGLTHFLVIETIKRIASEGGRGPGLNFAVLRTVVAGEGEGWVGRLGQPLLGRVTTDSQVASLWKFNAKYDPSWRPRYLVVDSLEFALTQGVVVAEAEGLEEVPLVGRFLGRART